jgi:hypothetical protein
MAIFLFLGSVCHFFFSLKYLIISFGLLSILFCYLGVEEARITVISS